jgi:hypothetical protein
MFREMPDQAFETGDKFVVGSMNNLLGLMR